MSRRETPCFNDFNASRQEAALGFAQQQVNVLGHDHVGVNAKLERETHTFERGFEKYVLLALVAKNGRR